MKIWLITTANHCFWQALFERALNVMFWAERQVQLIPNKANTAKPRTQSLLGLVNHLNEMAEVRA